MPYRSLCYQLVWATRERAPLIGPDLEADVWRAIRAAVDRANVHVHAVGGMPDHVHVAVAIPPTMAVVDAVRRLKGGSSHAVNQLTGGSSFGWQTEYGAVTFAQRHLPRVTAYIQNQQRHHGDQSLWPVLDAWHRLSETTDQLRHVDGRVRAADLFVLSLLERASLFEARGLSRERAWMRRFQLP